MKRFTWLRVFTGYLNSVPLITAWPTRVEMAASCSLKRLQYWYWDPGLSASQNLVNQGLQAVKNTNDGGVTNAVLTLLDTVVGWPASKVHIGGIPQDWFKFAYKIAKDVDAKAEEADALAQQFYAVLGGGGTVGGVANGSAVPTGTLKAGTYGGESLSAAQVGNAEIIYNTGVGMKANSRDCTIAIMAAAAESDLINLDHGDRDSVGLFQERPSQGWGTKAQCMDPVYASQQFYKRLLAMAGRDKLSLGQCAQRVERSSDSSGGIYTRRQPMATALVNILVKGTGTSLGSDPTFNNQASNWKAGKGTGADVIGVALKLVQDHPTIPYQYGGDSPPQSAVPSRLDCSSFVQWVYYHTFGKLNGLPRRSQEQQGWVRRISTDQALKTRGALVFVGTPAHHVEMSVGDGKHTVGSHKTGTYASVVNNSPSYWSGGGGLLQGVDYSADGGGIGTVGSAGGAGGTAPVNPGVQVGTANQQPWYNPNDQYDKLFGNNPWVPQFEIDTAGSEALAGVRAMLNDQPFLPYIKNMFSSTMRSFCSAPNGDLIAWFPDYYGIWGTAASMVIQPIELMDFSVEWSDDFFVTHQYTVAPQSHQSLDLLSGSVQAADPLQVVTTVGIATIDIPSIMFALFGLEPTKAEAQKFINYVFKRFGARPDFQQMPGVVGPKGEFFSALFLFMRQWAYQYNASVPLTFMPEMWPGMLIKIPDFNFQAYVTTVTHSFKFGKDGGFSTSVNIAAPARLSTKKGDNSGALIGLPLAGGLGAQNLGGK